MYRIQNWRLKILLSRTSLTPPILNSVRLSLRPEAADSMGSAWRGGDDVGRDAGPWGDL